MNNSSPLVLRSVTKHYGKARGVENLNLSVELGEVFGFLGPNGAGKSTTINMLVNLTKPTSGTITIFGKDNQLFGIEARRRIGYLAGDMELDGALTGKQQLEYFAALRGGIDQQHIQELAARLQANLSRKIKSLSRGNKQKIGLISALMHKPELLILDEPTSGLDPLIQSEFNKLVLEHKAKGGTTFISSHVLSEVQELCDTVAFIKNGAIIVNKPLSEIVRGAPKTIQLTTKHSQALKDLQALKGISQVTQKGHTLTALYSGNVTALLRRLANLDLEDVNISDSELETIFAEYYKGENV